MQKIFENLKMNPPLIHNITNYVTVNDCANVILAAGGSPLMADDIDEVEDIVSISGALYINVGTLNKRTIESMILAGEKANKIGIPVVLDPVGMGASNLRNNTVNRLIESVSFSVIKGNMSEIKALYQTCQNSGGVDAKDDDLVTSDTLVQGIGFAEKTARKFDSIIAVTGPIDIITDGKNTNTIHNGHPMMSKVTGTGCMTGSLIGTFCGANPDRILDATTTAVALMGLSGEKAHVKVTGTGEGTGSFRRYLIDQISLMGYESMKEGVHIEKY